MTFPLCSDCDPVTASSGGLLWIYDRPTTNGPELLEVSEASGQVLDTVPMPALDKPFLAANDQGVFVANSIYGGGPGPVLSYVAPGMASPVTLVNAAQPHACWMQAEGDFLWVGMGSIGTGGQGCGQETIWRLDGENPQPIFETPAPSGYIPPVVGGEREGLWTVYWPWPSVTSPSPVIPQLIYIDPDSGQTSVKADLPPISGHSLSGGGVQPGEAVLFDGSLYLLEPPTVAGGSGYEQLIRVSL